MIQYKEKYDAHWDEMKYPPTLSRDGLCILAERWNFSIREVEDDTGLAVWEFHPWEQKNKV